MVIGAGDGLGAACAHRFAKAGYRVVVVRRNRQKLQSLIDSINRAYSLRDLQACHGFGVDCRKEGSVQALFTTVERTIGAVHVTIFNIGANVRFNIRDTTARVFRKVWEMATFAGFLVGREAAKVMTKRQCRWSCDKGPARVDNADHNDNNNNTDNNKNSHVDHDNDTAMATNGSKFNLDHHHPSYTNMPSSSPLPAAAGSHGTIIFTGATAR